MEGVWDCSRCSGCGGAGGVGIQECEVLGSAADYLDIDLQYTY